MVDYFLISASNRHRMIHTLCKAIEKFDILSLKCQATYWRNEADKYLEEIKNNIQFNMMVQSQLDELKHIQESAHFLYVQTLKNVYFAYKHEYFL